MLLTFEMVSHWVASARQALAKPIELGVLFHGVGLIFFLPVLSFLPLLALLFNLLLQNLPVGICLLQLLVVLLALFFCQLLCMAQLLLLMLALLLLLVLAVCSPCGAEASSRHVLLAIVQLFEALLPCQS